MGIPLQQHPPALESRSPVQASYIRRIEDCFRCWPSAAPFYQPLIEYLRSASSPAFSRLQTPARYLLGHDLGRNGRIETGYESPANNPQRIAQPRITVVEGFLAPESIAVLGETYQVRPEFFIDHLASGSSAYGSVMDTRTQSDELPNLPSRRDNIIHIRFMSMLRMSTMVQGPRPFSTSLASRFDLRSLLETKRCLYEQRLFNHRHYGATRYRALHAHNEQWLTVEQMVSFSVKREGDKIWHGLLLIDGGREFKGVDLPWTEFVEHETDDHEATAGFVPVIPYNVPAVSAAVLQDANLEQSMQKHHRPPYHPAVDILLAASSPGGAEAQLLAEDPFYILSCIYHAAARTRIQLLSFIKSDIEECSTAATAAGGSREQQQQQSLVLDQLRFNMQLVRRVERFCKEDLESIERLGSAAWPRSIERAAEMASIQKKLLGDYDYLVKQCGNLALQCETASKGLISLAQWMEAREGIRESRNVANLTVLAIIFVPLGYVSSCLSMNVFGINQGVPLWIWGAASGFSVLITGAAIVVLTGVKRL